ncbi:hypothetical protein PIB30_019690 [Stylosanthes scabra]|uniref:Uncharacterized protein n=1 Tax=Stylosanthes scabra TaxID=79078 RepID=A0ABU6U9B0_9FABA|nr:hypothetical protein [Stylosanthes scabra]
MTKLAVDLNDKAAMKDQTNIGIVKVTSNMTPNLEVVIVKATNYDDDPVGEKYIHEIQDRGSSIQGSELEEDEKHGLVVADCRRRS